MSNKLKTQNEQLTLTGTMAQVTVLSGDVDYELDELASSCWIGVDNLSVYIRRTDVGVGIEVYAKGEEAEDPIEALFVSAEDAS